MKPDDYDYQSAGFDGFLSRSIDTLPQQNLDSAGPVSRQLAYDRAQVTGMLGDSYRMGDILFDGKEGRTTYYNNQDPFLLEGELFDGARGIRFQNSGGLGLAQFGIFGNGKLALKIAKDGFDVATATDDQLIFNSGQNVFKIVGTDTIDFPINFSAHAAVAYSDENNEVVVPHDLGYRPAVIAYLSDANNDYALPTLFTWVNDANRQQRLDVKYFVGANDVTFRATHIYEAVGAATAALSYSLSIRYYLLQETSR